MESLTSQSSIENSGTRGVDVAEQPMFIEITDRLGNTTRVINFKNKTICPREGIIELIPKKTSRKHENRVSFRSVRDRANDAIIGIPEYIDPKTQMWVFRKITLKDAETLDLSVEDHAKQWAVIRLSHFLEGSPNQKGKPLYFVRDQEQEAHKFLAKRKVKRDAVNIAEGLIGQDLIQMARNLGLSVEQNSVATLQMAVIKKAELEPERFMEIWDSPARKELTILKTALSLGIITNEPLTGITYQSISLGSNEPMAVQFLRENPSVCNTIDILNQQKENQTIKSMAASSGVKITDGASAELELMKREMEKLRKENESLKGVALETKLVEEVKGGKKDKEWEDLITEAKKLGIKQPHLKKKETLKKEIADIGEMP